MVKLDKIAHHIALPDGVSASLNGDNVTIAKEGTSVSREFRHPRLDVKQVDGGCCIIKYNIINGCKCSGEYRG